MGVFSNNLMDVSGPNQGITVVLDLTYLLLEILREDKNVSGLKT